MADIPASSGQKVGHDLLHQASGASTLLVYLAGTMHPASIVAGNDSRLGMVLRGNACYAYQSFVVKVQIVCSQNLSPTEHFNARSGEVSLSR